MQDGELCKFSALAGDETEPDEADAAYAPLGTLIDNRYFVEALIARVDKGVLYRCRHKSIGKLVAVKVLRKDLCRLADVPRRLLLEAQAAAALGNEHIVDITDFGTLPNGCLYLVLDLLDGALLSELIARRGALPLARVLAIGKQLAEGLVAAHAAGIVHGALKPESIFLLRRKSDDLVKILDFGIAQAARADNVPLTRASTIVGTPHYMSPEQALGANVDHRVDIYALGVILYELAGGRVPFYANNYLGLITQIRSEPPPPFRALIPAPAVPPEFERIVLECLDKQPEARFPSMQELLRALEHVERVERVERRSVAPLMVEASAPVSLPEAAPRRTAIEPAGTPTEQLHSHGSWPAVSGPYLLPSPRSVRFAIHALGATLVFLFSLTWLSYLQRSQPTASAGALSSEALPLPPPPGPRLPEVLPSEPPAVAALARTTPPTQPSELARVPASAPSAAPARKPRTPRSAPQETPPRVAKRVPVAPRPARSGAIAPGPDGLLEPWP